MFNRIHYIFLFCLLSLALEAIEVTEWENLYHSIEAQIPQITFNGADSNGFNLDKIKFNKYDISNSYRNGSRPVNIVVKGKYLYTISDDARLLQVEISSGRVVKKHKLQVIKKAVASGLSIYLDDIYISFESGELVSFSIDSGEINWRISLSAPINSVPVVQDNKVFVVSNNVVYAISSSSGDVLWNYFASKAGVSLRSLFAPTLYSGYLFLGFSSSDVIVLRQEHGGVFWKDNLAKTGSVATLINPIMGDIKSPIVPFRDSSGEKIVVASNNKVSVYDLYEGKEVWTNSTLGTYNTPIVIGSTLLFVDMNNNFVSLSTRDGQIKVTKPLPTRKKTAKKIFWFGPIVMEKELFLLNSLGEIVILSRVDYSVIASKTLFSFKKEKIQSPPVITSEYIIIFSNYGNLYINKKKG